jgi:hypothetical protein
VRGENLIMMWKSIFYIVMVTACLSFGAKRDLAQTASVELRFEMDGKEIKPRNAAVIFHTQNGSFLAKFKKHRVVVPKEVFAENSFDIQIVWNKYSVIFSPVSKEYLLGKWVVGADWPPMENETLRSAINKEKDLVILYYLRMDPKDLGKEIVVEVTK